MEVDNESSDRAEEARREAQRRAEEAERRAEEAARRAKEAQAQAAAREQAKALAQQMQEALTQEDPARVVEVLAQVEALPPEAQAVFDAEYAARNDTGSDSWRADVNARFPPGTTERQELAVALAAAQGQNPSQLSASTLNARLELALRAPAPAAPSMCFVDGFGGPNRLAQWNSFLSANDVDPLSLVEPQTFALPLGPEAPPLEPIEAKLGVRLDQVAATLAQGNAALEAAYATVYGGENPLTGQVEPPRWEALGLGRAEFDALVASEPWTLAGITEESFRELQALPGPAAALIAQGVEPQTAALLQETWTAHFYGGPDPVTGQTLAPVWERWGVDAQALAELFPDQPLHQASVALLAGGFDPVTGQELSAPWGSAQPSAYGAALAENTRALLGLDPADALRVRQVPPDYENLALSFTMPPVATVEDYFNPVRLAQSPSFRNAFLLPTHQTALAAALTDPAMQGVGMFGLVRMKLGEPLEGPAKQAALQAHGLFLVYPEEGGAPFVLAKLEYTPRFNGQGDPPDSQFVKFAGSFGAEGSFVAVIGSSPNGLVDSRARRPHFIGANWELGEDGPRQVGALFAKPWSALDHRLSGSPTGTVPHALGGQLQVDVVSGRPVLSGLGLVAEYGIKRYQLMPMVSWNPESGELTGGNLMLGTGWTLGSVGYQHVADDPSFRVVAEPSLADPVGLSLGPYVAYANPEATHFQVGLLSGVGGRTLGLALSTSSLQNTTVFLGASPGEDARALRAEAELLYEGLASGDSTLLDLPVGAGLCAEVASEGSLMGLGYYGLLSANLGGGTGQQHFFQALRLDEDTLVLSRYQQPHQEIFGGVGIFGIGPTLRWEGADLAGQSFAVDLSQLDPQARAELTAYAQTGLLPGALALDAELARQYEDAVAFIASITPADLQAEQLLAQGQAQLENAVAGLNARWRAQDFAPGDEVLPGVTLTELAQRDSRALRLSVVFEVGSTEVQNSILSSQAGTTYGFRLSSDTFLSPEISASSQARVSPWGNTYQLETTADGAFTSPELVARIANDVDPALLQAALAHGPGITQVPGTLAVRVNDAQLAELGRLLSVGPQGEALWADLEERAQAALSGEVPRSWSFARPDLDPATGAPLVPEGRVSVYPADLVNTAYLMQGFSEQLGERYGVDPLALAQKLEHLTPASFDALEPNEQLAVIEAVVRLGTSEQSPFGAVAMVALIDDPTTRAKAWLGSGEVGEPPVGVVRGSTQTFVGTLGDPTSEFLRFVGERLDGASGSAMALLEESLFAAASFTSPYVPSAVEALLAETDPARLSELSVELGLSPEQLARLAESAPFVFTMTERAGLSLEGLLGLRDAVGLTPDEVLGLFAAVGAGPDGEAQTFVFLQNLSWKSVGYPENQGAWVAALLELAAQGEPGEAFAVGLSQGADYLERLPGR